MASDLQLDVKILYVTREEYPSYRVDLTELFSGQLTRAGLHTVWMMQSEHEQVLPGDASGHNESYILQKIYPRTRLSFKLANRCLDYLYAVKLAFVKPVYDIVQVRDKVLAGLFAWVGARRAGVPFVYWMSWPYPETYIERARTDRHLGRALRWYYYLNGHIGKWLLYRWVLPGADHIFVQSERMKEDVESQGIDGGKMTPVPMGVGDWALQFEPVALRDYPFDVERPTIGYLGALDRLRGIDFLLDVVTIIKKRLGDCQLVLIGSAADGSESELVDAVRRRGLERDVVMTGMVPREVAWTYLLRVDACLSLFAPNQILASASPTKLVEYMALGRPVVVNDQPEQRKLVSESGGGLVAAYAVEPVAECALRILEDPERAQVMGIKGRAYIGRHRVYSQIAREVGAVYQKILKKGGGRRVRCAVEPGEGGEHHGRDLG